MIHTQQAQRSALFVLKLFLLRHDKRTDKKTAALATVFGHCC
jgi:hypothetical protein